jgi:hypothetical protein
MQIGRWIRALAPLLILVKARQARGIRRHLGDLRPGESTFIIIRVRCKRVSTQTDARKGSKKFSALTLAGGKKRNKRPLELCGAQGFRLGTLLDQVRLEKWLGKTLGLDKISFNSKEIICFMVGFKFLFTFVNISSKFQVADTFTT